MMIHDTQMHFISFKLTGRCYLFASRGFISLPVKARAQMNYSYVFCLSVGLWIKFKPRFTCVSCLASACLSDILISYETFYIYGQNCKRNIQPLGQILVYHSLFQFLTKKFKKLVWRYKKRKIVLKEDVDTSENESDVKITRFMALNCHATAKSISTYASFT